MARRKVKKILSDQKKHNQAESVQVQGEESREGSMPTSGSKETTKTTLEEAQNMGLYEDQDEEHPDELGIAEEIEKDEKTRLTED